MMTKVVATIIFVILFIALVFSLLGKSKYRYTVDYSPLLDSSNIKTINLNDGHWTWEDLNWSEYSEPKISIDKKEYISKMCFILSKSKRITVDNIRPIMWLDIEVVNKNGNTLDFQIYKNFQQVVVIDYDGRLYSGDSLINFIHSIATK